MRQPDASIRSETSVRVRLSLAKPLDFRRCGKEIRAGGEDEMFREIAEVGRDPVAEDDDHSQRRSQLC